MKASFSLIRIFAFTLLITMSAYAASFDVLVDGGVIDGIDQQPAPSQVYWDGWARVWKVQIPRSYASFFTKPIAIAPKYTAGLNALYQLKSGKKISEFSAPFPAIGNQLVSQPPQFPISNHRPKVILKGVTGEASISIPFPFGLKTGDGRTVLKTFEVDVADLRRGFRIIATSDYLKVFVSGNTDVINVFPQRTQSVAEMTNSVVYRDTDSVLVGHANLSERALVLSPVTNWVEVGEHSLPTADFQVIANDPLTVKALELSLSRPHPLWAGLKELGCQGLVYFGRSVPEWPASER